MTAWLAVFALVSSRSAGADDAGKKYKVQDLVIEGSQAFEDSRLRRLMVTRPSGFLSTSSYHRDVLLDDLTNLVSFYHQRGFLDAAIIDTTIRTDSLARTVWISIRIEEGEPTRVEGMTIFGNTVFSDSVLLSQVDLVRGDPFRRSAVQNGMIGMLNLYADSGYLDAAVAPDIKISDLNKMAVIDFTVTEHARTYVEAYRIEGLDKTKPHVVWRDLILKPGDVVSYSQLMKSQRRLYELGLFTSVFVRPLPGKDSTHKVILVELKEKLSGEFNIAVGFGSVEKARGRIELLSRNVAGTGRQLGSSLTASFIRRAVETSFTEPRMMGTQWRTDVNVLFEFLEEPGYDLSRIGGRMTLGRFVGRYASVEAKFRFEHATLRHVEVEEPIGDFDSDIRSVALSLVSDTRDDLFNPASGMYMEISNEVAGAFLKGNNTFARSIFRWKYFHPWERHSVVASAFEAGWMDVFGGADEVPLNERFYAGGPNSVRGFGYQLCGPLDSDGDPVGGKFKIVWNIVELRRTIYKMVGLVSFVDVGNIWPSITDFDVSDIRPSAGMGIRANTPLGILRLDYGVNLDRKGDESRAEWHFSMGQAF